MRVFVDPTSFVEFYNLQNNTITYEVNIKKIKGYNVLNRNINDFNLLNNRIWY